MIEKILRRLFQRGTKKLFGAWQIELTTRCPLRCKMCIRTETKDWQHQDMDLENFKRVLPYLRDVQTVILEGWGESLLHRDLAECIRLVKQEGPQVGFVTSGMGLTRDRGSELIEAGIDFVGFSISGTDPQTHDAIRINSHLPEVLEAIRIFREEKARRGLDRPRMHIVFLMVKENIAQVPAVPAFAREMGVPEVVLINICHMINPWQEKQRVFVWERDQNPYEKFVGEAEANARALKLKLSRPSLHAVDVAVCDENPLQNLYISADGEVSPCVYLYPALPSPFKRLFCGKEHAVDRVTFGNIFRDPFVEIWDRENYRRFRDCFAERRTKFKELYAPLWDEPKLKSLSTDGLPAPPDSCQTCHKILGV